MMRWLRAPRGLRRWFCLRLGFDCRWRRRNSCTEYRHEILAHLAHVADALRDAEPVETFENFNREPAPDAAAIAELRGGESRGHCLRDHLCDGRELGQCCARIKALGRHANHF